MKPLHKVGDKLIEFYMREEDRNSCDEPWIIWRIESINGKQRYTCTCIKGDEDTAVGHIIHFHRKNYEDWYHMGYMRDYEDNHFDEDLFTI